MIFWNDYDILLQMWEKQWRKWWLRSQMAVGPALNAITILNITPQWQTTLTQNIWKPLMDMCVPFVKNTVQPKML